MKIEAVDKDSLEHTAATHVSTLVTGARNLRLYWAIFVFCCVLMCAPFWAVTYPPLLDYPNHLARAFVLAHYDQYPAYQRAYDILHEPLPNLAIDLVVPSLAHFVEIRTAGKLFLTLMVLLFACGCHLLGVALYRRPTWLALAFALLVFNQTVFWGFVNYFFGVGLFLVSLSYWLRWRTAWTAWRLGLTTLLVFACYLAHLSAYAFCGVSFALLTGFAWWEAKRFSPALLLNFVPLVPSLLTFITFMRGTGEPGGIIWAGARAKFTNLAAWAIGYHYYFDVTLAAVIVLLGVILWRSAAHRQIVKPTLALGAVFWLLYLACPQTLFTSYSADVRFIAPALLFTLLSFRLEVAKSLGVGTLAICLLVVTLRSGSVWEAWRRVDLKTAGQVALFQHLPLGARVYPITFFPPGQEDNKNERPIHHSIHYATIYQQTLSPTFFALKGQHSLVFKVPPVYVKVTPAKSQQAIPWERIFAQNDFIWAYQLNADYRQFLLAHCELIAEQEGGLILRIRPQQSQQQGAASNTNGTN